MNDFQDLDPAGVARLQRLGGDVFVCKMIDLFLSYTAEKIAEARQALVNGDAAGVAKAAHPIKSSAGNVGAARVQELATRLEALARDGGAGLSETVEGLERAFASVKPKLVRKRRALSRKAK